MLFHCKSQKGNSMGLGYMLTGFLFLGNPVIHVIDIFPDCIGFWLIVQGLTKCAFFIDKLAEAKRCFWRLFWIDLVKAVSILLWPYVADSAMLLLAFVFSILELMYFIPAMTNLMEGISFAGVWYKGTAVYATSPRRIFKYKRQLNEDGKYENIPLPAKERGIFWRNFTIVIYCIRIAFTLIPEAVGQMLYDRYMIHAMSVNLAEYKPLMYIILGFLLCIVGLFWVIGTVRYLGGILRDKVFIDLLIKKYKDDILPNTNLFIAIDMRRVLFLFAAVTVTSIMCSFDGVNLMIGALPALFLCFAALILGKRMHFAYAAIPFALIRIVLSIVNLLKQLEYFRDYSVDSVNWVSNAFKMYYNMAYLNMAEHLVAITPMLIIAICLIRSVRTHLDRIGIQEESVQYSQKARNKEIFNRIQIRGIFNIVLMAINYIVSAVYPFAKVYLDVMSFIVIAVTVVWVIQTLVFTYAVNNEVYDRMAENY